MKIKVLPAFNGDALLISFPYEGKTKNVLIDGGVPRTYVRELKPLLESLIEYGQLIDLLVVTHIDDDHIGGIKELYQDTKFNKSFIKEVWFNSGNLLSDYFSNEREKDREVPIILNDRTDMSVDQGVTLENELLKEGNWIQRVIKAGQENLPGAAITVLSPTDIQLKKLHSKWHIEADDKTKMSGSEHEDFSIPISKLIERPFKEDKAVPNGSSIAVLLEVEGKKLLLLADSYPSVVVAALKKEGYSAENKLKVDLVKVSHHASKGNTSPELLSVIESKRFIISTDGSKHGLPDKEAIARIIEAHPGCTIYFNYEEIAKDLFLREDLEHYNFQCSFLSELNYTIDL